MKRKLQLKQKIMIGAGAGLLGATAIATPLAITLSKTHASVLDDFDSQYGIDRTVYNNMKGDLTNKYRSNLEEQRLSDEEKAAKMAKLASSLSNFDNAVQLQAKKSQANVYTAATSALMNTAKNDFEVDLVRNSRANWNEIEDMFKGMSNSFDTYMSNHGFDRIDIDRILANATSLKVNLVNRLKTEYANDILGGVLKAKTQLLSCFDAINTEIARLAAEMRLTDFISNYRFEYKEVISKNGSNRENRLNIMKDAKVFTEGQQISNDNMNKIFTCYNAVTRQKIDFNDENMIPGYKLIPVFAGTVENPLTNEYSIKIDWRAVSQNFAESEDAEAATAHLIDVDQQFVDEFAKNKDKIKTFDDFFNHANEHIKLTEYRMLVTADFESQELAKTYFNPSANGSNVDFVWDQRFNPCYDGFMYLDQNSEEAQTLNLRQLALTNIAIKANGCEPRLLKDVIATVEQENYQPKDIIENFVQNCDVIDAVQITRSGGKITSVTNNLTANYKNQIRWDMHGQESIGATPFGGTKDAKDLKISEVFFGQVNAEYNRQRSDSYVLLDKEYRKLDNKDNFWKAISVIATLVNLLAETFYWVGVVNYCKKGDFFTACAFVIMGVVTTLILVLEGYLDGVFLVKFVHPVEDYADRADEFNEETDVINAVKKTLNDDLKDHFVIIDKDHPYNPETYNPKLEAFRALDPSEQQKLFAKYHYFKKDTAKTFFDEANRLKINPEQFKQDFADWYDDYGAYSKLSFVTGITLLVLLGLLGWIVNEALKDLNAQAKAEEEAQSGFTKEELARISEAHDTMPRV